MKSLKLFFLIIAACFICSGVHAQQTDEVTLVVSADGPTKDEATKTALRSAIEQAYGTFVSANTTILNDELVKDEIVTISTGNIKEYKEISSEQMPNGNMYVTLQATVSISKLVSYAQSKGAETEFAGATFGMNMKMKELNKRNEEIALDNLVEQVLALYPSAFSYRLKVSEPMMINNDRKVTMEDGWRGFILPVNPSDIGLQGTYENFYASNLTIGIEVDQQQMKTIKELIETTLYSLALSNDEIAEYEKLNLEYYETGLFRDNLGGRTTDNYRFGFRSYDIYNCFFRINQGIAKILGSFQIVDNLGNVSKITSWTCSFATSNNIGLSPASGTNLLTPYSLYSKSVTDSGKNGNQYMRYYIEGDGISLLDTYYGPFIEMFILFPKNEISKYLNFRIEATPVDEIVIEDPRELLKIDK